LTVKKIWNRCYNACAQSVRDNPFRVALGAALALAAVFFPDLAAAAPLMFIGDIEPPKLKELQASMEKAFTTLQDNIKRNQDSMDKAIDELKRGDAVHAKTADDLKELGSKTQKSQEEFKTALNAYGDRMRDIEQKLDKRPGPGEGGAGKTAGEVFAESDSYKQMIKSRGFNSLPVEIERKTAILNPAPLTPLNPLVPPQLLPGIIMPGLRRFTIRDLIPNLSTSQNLIEFASELLFTNNAGPQFDPASPGSVVTEGAPFNESALTFQLSQSPVVTIGHYIPASRQILSDAVALAGYINSRLTYGLKLEEENELLNGVGTAGKLNGLINQSAAFTGGATNQTIIDTLLKAFTQVSLSFFDASAVVLHPLDWQSVLLQKDTLGRYLFADPHSASSASIWGKTVVPTQAIAQGTFHAGAYDLAASIFDRESITIRTAEQHLDWFTRNLVAILCEERLALCVYRTASMVTGTLNYAG
jgi:HK97 family phage major capsid protein